MSRRAWLSAPPAIGSRDVTDGARRQVRHRAGGVHDFAWTAWPGFEQRHERVLETDVHLLYPPGHEQNAAVTLSTLRFALPHFSARYGPYPYPDLTVVHPPAHAGAAGGMEYPTLITTGGAWHASYWSRAVELVTLHELGHQWFYGLVATTRSALAISRRGPQLVCGSRGRRGAVRSELRE